ncbi:MAG: transposase, partial [Candidatus Krumholzibacteria bacterium]|nr:transposase [Candidatus Krumholzibacteria bacterium]
MRFFTDRYPYYCGVDLHARSMYLCVIDDDGQVKLHRNIDADPDAFLDAIAPYADQVVVGVECIFTWYWLADLCAEQQIPFILGHALYMKAIHGGKAKNDRIDSLKIATLMRGGSFPMAYVYPAEMHATSNLLRRQLQNTCGLDHVATLGRRRGSQRGLIRRSLASPDIRERTTGPAPHPSPQTNWRAVAAQPDVRRGRQEGTDVFLGRRASALQARRTRVRNLDR